MRLIILIILTSLLTGCNQLLIDKELILKTERLVRENDSLKKIIDESHGVILGSELKILPSSGFVPIGDTIDYQIIIKIQRQGDVYPYLYYSDTCSFDKYGLPVILLGQVDSVKMIDWQANISLPQNKIGQRHTYFKVKRMNKFGDFEEYQGISEFLVLPKTKFETIEKILKE